MSHNNNCSLPQIVQGKHISASSSCNCVSYSGPEFNGVSITLVLAVGMAIIVLSDTPVPEKTVISDLLYRLYTMDMKDAQGQPYKMAFGTRRKGLHTYPKLTGAKPWFQVRANNGNLKLQMHCSVLPEVIGDLLHDIVDRTEWLSCSGQCVMIRPRSSPGVCCRI